MRKRGKLKGRGKKLKLGGRSEKNWRVKEIKKRETPLLITGTTQRKPNTKNSQFTIEGMVGNERSPMGWRKERRDKLFVMGTGSESLANKEGKLEETLEINSGSMGLFRNDGDKIAQHSSEDARQESWRRKRKKNNSELHSSQINFYSWKNIFLQTLFISSRKWQGDE